MAIANVRMVVVTKAAQSSKDGKCKVSVKASTGVSALKVGVFKVHLLQLARGFEA